jgi:catechol 2,3-dioxygenase-like lactoylglutathione lyase family enzyme
MLRIDHIVYPTWNAAACLRFYREIMGLALVGTMSGDDWGGYPWLMMFFRAPGGGEVVLVKLDGAAPPKKGKLPRDVRHLAFAEKSVAALGKWRAKLRATNVAFWEETHGVQHSLYFEDPDGRVLEITAPPSDGKRRPSRAALARAESWLKAARG